MNDMNNIEDLLPFYALDALTEDEKEYVEEELRKHPDLQFTLDEMQAAAELMPLIAEVTAPSPSIKSALMTRIAQEKPAVAPAEISQARVRAQPTSPSLSERLQNTWQAFQASFFMPALTVGSMAAAVFLLFWTVALRNEVQGQTSMIATVQAETAVLQQTNNALQEQLNQQDTILALYTNPETVAFNIEGTEFQEGASGQFVFNPSEQEALLLVSGLSPLNANSTYQFWLIGESGPVSAGIFNVDETGEGTLRLAGADIASFTNIGVSVEPAGGSEQPTGNIVMLGSL